MSSGGVKPVVTSAATGLAGAWPTASWLIPTIVLLYGIDIKTAGSLSLLVSLPTMLVAFGSWSRDNSFRVLRENLRSAAVMVTGSITGALLGGVLLGVVPDLVLIPALAVALPIWAVKLPSATARPRPVPLGCDSGHLEVGAQVQA